MTHVITTFGGGEAFYYVFEGIAALMGSQGFMNNLFRLGGMVGLLWVFVMVAFRNAWEQAFFWLFWFMVATLVLFTPRATVWIKDPLSFTAPRKVDNVPFALAAVAGISSQIGTALTEKMESLFTLPDYLPYHQTGTVFASKLVMKAHLIKITDPEFKANMERFVNRCVVYDAMIGHKYTLKDLQRSTDVWHLVSTHASPVLGFLYKPPGTGQQGSIVTCRQGAQQLQNLWQQQLKEAALVYGTGFFQKDARAAQNAFMTYLPQSFQLLTKVASDAPKLLQQEMMINAIRDDSHHKLDELRGSVGYATARALLNQEMNNRTMGEVASEMLVIAKAVIEALCYASFIFVVVLSLVHNGYRILWNYMGVLIWLQMWAPLYAVLNLFMSLYGQYRSSSLMMTGGLTMMNSAGLTQIQSQVASMAGWLSCSLPFLAYGIVKGGVGSFMNMASNIISSSQGAVSAASTEAASGNFSLGNVTMGTQAFQNTTAFQSNQGPSFRDGSFEQVLEDGTRLITQADGRQVFTGGAGNSSSSSRLKFDLSSSLGARAEEASTHQASLLQSQSEEYAQSRMEAARQVMNLAQSMGRGQNSSKGFAHDASVGQSQSLSQAMRFSKSLEDRFGFSESQAADITASVMAGTPKWLGISADVKGSGSSKADRSKTMQDIQNMARDMGVSNSLDEATRSVRDHRFSSSHSQEARLAQDIGSTMERSENIRESMGRTQQILDSYNKVQALSHAEGITMNRDGYQELLEFAARESRNGHALGMRGAQFLLEQGGMEAEEIQARFADARFSQIQSRIEGGMSLQSEADIKALYNNTSLGHSNALSRRVDKGVGHVTASSVQTGGQRQGLTDPIDTFAEHAYRQQSGQVAGDMVKAQGSLSERGERMQTSNDQNWDRSILGAAAFNAGEGVARTAVITFSAIDHAPDTIRKIVDPSGYTSNFEKPSGESSPQHYDQSWKWNASDSSSEGTSAFPGSPGNTVIVRQVTEDPVSQREKTALSSTSKASPSPSIKQSNFGKSGK